MEFFEDIFSHIRKVKEQAKVWDEEKRRLLNDETFMLELKHIAEMADERANLVSEQARTTPEIRCELEMQMMEMREVVALHAPVEVILLKFAKGLMEFHAFVSAFEARQREKEVGEV